MISLKVKPGRTARWFGRARLKAKPAVLPRLKRQFIVISLSLITVILAAALSIIYYTFRNQQISQTQLVLDEVIENGTSSKVPLSPSNSEEEVNIPTLFVEISGGKVYAIGSDFNVDDQSAVQTLVQAALDQGKTEGTLSDYKLRFLLRYYNDAHVRIAFADQTHEISSMRTLSRNLLLGGGFMWLTFLLISFFLASWALKPVERTWQQQKQFIEDASHELKTPLTVMVADLSLIRQQPDSTVATQEHWLDSMDQSTRSMTALINNLLTLARLEQPELKLDLLPLDLSRLLTEVCLNLEAMAFEADKPLKTDIREPLWIRGDRTQLTTLFGTLIENAVKYGQPGQDILVRLFPLEEHEVQVQVRNWGQVIEPEQMKHVFDRFYRVDAAREHEAGGFGLGLSIAQRIAGLHRTAIQVNSSQATGTIFSVSFERCAPLKK
ncbi:MAG: HAMP domain-containing sensor histidine kinase [Oscillospiraceae bacterium]|nr:HAMP domain-containing sensor histidine kinase [Oscillospiraceae bacterium]